MAQILDLGKIRFQYKGDWSVSTEYQFNDVVNYKGSAYCYVSTAKTTGTLTSNTTFWGLMAKGSNWEGTYSGSSTYGLGSIVGYQGNLYQYTASVAYAGTVPTDTSKCVLFISQNTTSNNVFYVAPHGTDVSGSGFTLSQPFASIKYACQQAPAGSTIFVKTGTYNEQLPITVPANTAIVGDNQRTVIVQPKAGNDDSGTRTNAESTMFFMSDGSILNKMTFKGMGGWVPGSTPADVTTSTIKAVVVRLNPASPIVAKSPYVLECSAIGSGCIGALIDGSVHATGAKTMIFHGYTIIGDNGIGFWVKDGGKAEIVSCFTYYCYFGYTASGGGFIRALNGNNSYGTWGATSRGFDSTEAAVSGTLFGQQLNIAYTGGNINVGDTVTSSAGGTATVTNAQITGNKIYVSGATGTFTVGNTLTFTSGGTATVATGALENQKGFILILNGLTARPVPGASITITGDSISYVVQSVSGTYLNATSVITLVLAQEKTTGSASGTGCTFRYKYSQIRLTGHDFLSIGTGGIVNTNYPGTPIQAAVQGNETDEVFPGRVYYVSTDQDGNFRVGEYFRIDQATGRATLNASAFDLAGLTSLKLGSIGAQLGETINEFSSDGTLSGNSNLAVPTEAAVKTYVDTRDATKQNTLVSGTNIKTVNSNSLLGSGDITISTGLVPLAKGQVNLAQYFTDINWPGTNTNTYGWLIQRTYNVATGVAQFALIQGGQRPTSLGGNSGTVFPFQIAADNSFIAGTPVRMWSNSGSPSDFSTCSLMTDNKSGGFHYSGNIPWPGTGGHTMGWGTGLLNANNSASTFTNSGTTTSQGIHDHNGQYFGLPDSDGWGWYGCNNGYASDDGQTRIHQINYSNPDSPSISVQTPGANTSTSPVMQFILQDTSTTANTAISGSCHWRNGSSQVVARVFSPNFASGYQDYNSSANWSESYVSGQYYGFALANGNVIVYHGPGNTWVYSAFNSRTNVSASSPFAEQDFRGSCIVNDGTNSWLVLSGASDSVPFLQKWTINPSTYVWTLNWESENPILFGTSSYLKLNKLPNNRLMVGYRASSGIFKYWIFNRSQFPA